MYTGEFIIDKITNSIEEIKTGKVHETLVLAVTEKEIRSVQKKNGWRFDWEQEYRLSNRQVYKLILVEGDSGIQGLISCTPIYHQYFIEMNLIETAPHNYGSKKQFLGVPANMVAYVCKMSMELGFEGYVGFEAKTRLIEHYKKTLGAGYCGANRMTIYPKEAEFLVNSYYKNYHHGRP